MRKTKKMMNVSTIINSKRIRIINKMKNIFPKYIDEVRKQLD